ncbi:MAG: zf-HC2 domain-containing protein [Thermoguttaceae bacterium]|jgi:hypothetical protein
MSQEPINAESSVEEQLVAYLDGELDGESCRRIEELLAVDPEVRRKLHWLEQTWEVLDELDTTPVGEDFTRSTMEMVALAAEEDVRKSLDEGPRRRRRTWLLCGGGMLAAGLAGFMAFTLLASNPNRELNKALVQDLPVLEKLDEYQQIQDIKFLRMLEVSGLFPKVESKEGDIVSSPPTALRAGEDLAQHIKKDLDPNQKADLLQKERILTRLEPAEQNQLRQLHEEIQTDAHAEELRGIMNRYYEWFKLLPSYYRLELPNMTAEARIKWIRDYKQKEQTEITNRPPAGKDSEALWKWMEDYESKHEKAFLENQPDLTQKKLKGMAPSDIHHWVMWMMWPRLQAGQNKESPFSDVDLSELRSIFTPGTRILLEAKSKDQQITILQNWAHFLVRPRRGPGMEGPVDDKLLADFFDKDLDEAERDRLMNLPPEDMQQQLQGDYIMKNRPPGMFPRRMDEFGPGQPPGPGFGPDRRGFDRAEKPENPAKKP